MKKTPPRKFAAFILTHGRPDRVFTHKTLRNYGYSGPIYLMVDDQDKTVDEYKRRFGEEVVVFDKKAAAALTDSADNTNAMRGVVYARNANFEAAKGLGLTHFIQLDDDYTNFAYRYDKQLRYHPKSARNLDVAFAALVEFLEVSGAHAVAMAQGGDFIGGSDNDDAQRLRLSRKVMNTFVCSVERPFRFLGRINEDTTAYVHHGSKGLLFFTMNQMSIAQIQTQTNSGGMTELYLDFGTYTKSFYSVLYNPSSVLVKPMGDRGNMRLHHSVNWRCTVPKILPEALRKPDVVSTPEV